MCSVENVMLCLCGGGTERQFLINYWMDSVAREKRVRMEWMGWGALPFLSAAEPLFCVGGRQMAFLRCW